MSVYFWTCFRGPLTCLSAPCCRLLAPWCAQYVSCTKAHVTAISLQWLIVFSCRVAFRCVCVTVCCLLNLQAGCRQSGPWAPLGRRGQAWDRPPFPRHFKRKGQAGESFDKLPFVSFTVCSCVVRYVAFIWLCNKLFCFAKYS